MRQARNYTNNNTVDDQEGFDDFCNFEDSFGENDFAEDSAFNRGLFDTRVLKMNLTYSKPPASEARLPFDKSNIIHGNPIFVRKKLSYTAHASTVYSVDQALAIVDYIGKKTWSEHSLPYAISMIENGQPLNIVEDGGEFACGEVLLKCLEKVEGFNVLVCVSRHVGGCFVAEMVQCQKHKTVKEAANKVLQILLDRLIGKSNPSFHSVPQSRNISMHKR